LYETRKSSISAQQQAAVSESTKGKVRHWRSGKKNLSTGSWAHTPQAKSRLLLSGVMFIFFLPFSALYRSTDGAVLSCMGEEA